MVLLLTKMNTACVIAMGITFVSCCSHCDQDLQPTLIVANVYQWFFQFSYQGYTLTGESYCARQRAARHG
jgi:hypothetical protein